MCNSENSEQEARTAGKQYIVAKISNRQNFVEQITGGKFGSEKLRKARSSGRNFFLPCGCHLHP